MNEIYDYNNLISRFYDVIYDKILDKSGLQFYLDEIAKADGATLEVGAGTGRIFIPAMQSGADIYGIDQSAMMLEKLKQKLGYKDSESISLADVKEMSLNKKFKLIIAPFRMFQHLLSIDDQLKALHNINEHLEDGGKFIFDVFLPDLAKIISIRNEVPDFDGEYEPGKRLQRFATIKNNYPEQILDITFKFVWDENGIQNTDKIDLPLRYFFRYELENLLGRSNFETENIYGDFNKGRLNIKSMDMIFVCKKRS